MKKGITLLLVCGWLAAFTSCINATVGNGAVSFGMGKTIVGNGIFKEKEIGKLDFAEIESRGSIDVFISASSDMPVKVSGDENLIDYVEVKVENGVLKVQSKDGFNWTTKNPLKVIVPNNGKIRRIAASGSSDVTVESGLTANDFALNCKGSSDFKGDITAVNCDLNMSGSSDFKGNLKAEKLKLTFSGSSDYKGNIEATEVNIDCSGSSDCLASGFAEVAKISMSGSSDFKGYDFTAKRADCLASGSSDIQITCTDELSVRAGGSSDVYYKGDAKVVSVSTSGSSELKKR